MPDSLRRTIRTIAQVAIAAGLTALYAVIQGWNVSPTHTPSVADLKGGAVYVVFAILVAVITWGQNHLEDVTSWFPALLKAPPSPGANPVPPNAGGDPPLPH
jgi:hypothetical protein